MENCWTCETEVSGYHFTCNVCDKTRTMLFESPRVSKSTTLSKFIEYSFADLFWGKEDSRLYIAADISSTLENIASTIEWGFEELSWRMEQMTTVLESIDHSLKTPEETKANEQRLMAEELRRRGVLTDSEKFFLKSLELNPLDYRTYIGLSQTHLQMSKFDEAIALLIKSLPHTLKNIHKSYAHRLIGRTLFAEGKYEQAVEALELSIKLSPGYALGHYDYAKYCALTRRKEHCLSSLEIALTQESSLLSLAEKDKILRVVGGVNAIIKPDLNFPNTAPFKVRLHFYKLEKEFNVVEGILAKLIEESSKEHSHEIKACRQECARAKLIIEKVRREAFRLYDGKTKVRFPSLAIKSHLTEAVQQTEIAKNKVLDLEKQMNTPS